jgi:hypothetical protein
VARSKGSRGEKKPSGEGKSKYRSAVSGRYVTTAHARRAPKTTVRESPSARARRIKGELREQGRYFDDSTEIIRRDRDSR